jgi:hypothetical protein
MAATAPERVAVLIVRAWHEGDGPRGLRARVTSVVNVEDGPEVSQVVAGREEILACVRRWLEQVAP